MDDQILGQLNRQIDEHHECLCRRLDELADAIRAIHANQQARMEAHEAYHHHNEHRWGLLKLAERYPFRLAGVAFIVAWGLIVSAPESLHWMGQAVSHLLRLVFR